MTLPTLPTHPTVTALLEELLLRDLDLTDEQSVKLYGIFACLVNALADTHGTPAAAAALAAALRGETHPESRTP